MPAPRRYHKKKQARGRPLASIGEKCAPTSREESGAATDDESLQLTSREERLARRLARQKDFISNPGSAATVRKFRRALASTKSGLAQFDANLANLRRLSESGRATGPAQAVQEKPPAPPNPSSDTATPFPLIPIPIPIPPPGVIQQIERAASGCWIYIDGAGRPVAQVIPHVYFPWPAPPAPPPQELKDTRISKDDDAGSHYYYPYLALPARAG